MTSPLDKVAATFRRLTHLPTFVVLPRYRATLHDLTIELFVSQRKLPFLAGADALIVPVGQDLKMVFGVAKMARDRGADIIQVEASRVAPLNPGDAFVGTGARYRYKYTALAVIFDESKRTSPAIITQAVSTAVTKLRAAGARSVVIADMTENLLAQPNWITQEQRRATAAITAKIMVEAIIACGNVVKTVKIWCSEPDNAQFFVEELKHIHDRERRADAVHA
jgi:hypothetical protein